MCFTGLNQQIFVAPFDVRQIMARVRLVLRMAIQIPSLFGNLC